MATKRSGPRPVAERLKRLLVILPWLTERREASLAEMSARFQMSEHELVRDLELASMCGLPPYLDEMVDLRIEDGMAYVDIPRFFTRPLQLTAPEGFALLAAGRAAMELPGADADGPLGRALAKLADVLGDDAMVVELAQPPATADLIAAADTSELVSITYWSASSDSTSVRVIAPRAVFSDRGHWYVTADDRRSGDERTFRVDRIESWTRTGEHDVARSVSPRGGDAWFSDSPDLPVVTLRLASATAWAIERLPVRSVVDDGDAQIATLVVSSELWLEQLLLRLGPDATVLEPEAWRDLGPRAAAALLAARYADA